MQIIRDISNIDVKDTIVTIGAFDGVHKGHKCVLNKLKQIAQIENKKSLVFTFWPPPRMVLQPNNSELKLLNSLNERIELIEEQEIDYLIIYPFSIEFSKLSACDFIKTILVEKLSVFKLVIGFNHHFGHNRDGSFENLKLCSKQYNFEIEKLNPYKTTDIEISSTLIRKLLINGEISNANKLLGYSYFINGKVVEGSKVGHSLGFPTANIAINEKYKLIPQKGAYAVEVIYNKNKYSGMLNIGHRPTISNNDQKKSIEVNIFNFNYDIYGKEIKILFSKRIRDEIKFNNTESLKKQLQNDKKTVLEILRKQKS